jgi:hypothetical protein
MAAHQCSELSFSFTAKTNEALRSAVIVCEMTNGIRRVWVVSTLASMLFLGLTTASGATTTIGSNLLSAPNESVCVFKFFTESERPCSAAQATLAPGHSAAGGLTAPIDGVVVRWRILSGTPTIDTVAAKVRLRILRGNAGAGGGTSAFNALSPGLQTFPARLPIQAGDRLGLDSRTTNKEDGEAGLPILHTEPAIGVSERFSADFLEGIDEPSNGTENNSELLLNADIEPDADGDGYGDETQDRCATNAALHTSCPVAGDTTPPTTKLTYKPRQDFLASHKVVVYIRSNEAGKAFAGGQLEIGSGKHKGRTIYGLHKGDRKVKARKKTKLTLRLPKKTWQAAERAIANGKKTLVKVTVSVTDAAGNESGRTVASIAPRP